MAGDRGQRIDGREHGAEALKAQSGKVRFQNTEDRCLLAKSRGYESGSWKKG
jgi:hypothetical protein